jgi:hypothetical protein
MWRIFYEDYFGTQTYMYTGSGNLLTTDVYSENAFSPENG